jgi:hypothetical protein
MEHVYLMVWMLATGLFILVLGIIFREGFFRVESGAVNDGIAWGAAFTLAFGTELMLRLSF